MRIIRYSCLPRLLTPGETHLRHRGAAPAKKLCGRMMEMLKNSNAKPLPSPIGTP